MQKRPASTVLEPRRRKRTPLTSTPLSYRKRAWTLTRRGVLGPTLSPQRAPPGTGAHGCAASGPARPSSSQAPRSRPRMQTPPAASLSLPGPCLGGVGRKPRSTPSLGRPGPGPLARPYLPKASLPGPRRQPPRWSLAAAAASAGWRPPPSTQARGRVPAPGLGPGCCSGAPAERAGG